MSLIPLFTSIFFSNLLGFINLVGLKKRISVTIGARAIVFLMTFHSAIAQQKTYCNPINIDYGYCPIPDFVKQGKHRATADPVITFLKANIICSPPTNGVIGTAKTCSTGNSFLESSCVRSIKSMTNCARHPCHLSTIRYWLSVPLKVKNSQFG